ncbi:MAG: NYN domain-containing protein [Streptosporangiaceae bacterium]
MDRCALFVDAGYMLADGATAVHGTRRRESVSWDYEGLLRLLGSLARDRTGLPLLRCYWYEATVEGRRTAEHDALADLPGIKLRLAKLRPGRREGVETEIHRDLTVLGRNRAISDAVVVSAEEDLAQVLSDVQDLGLRVTIVHVTVDGNWTISRSLRQECDDIMELTSAHLRPYAELISGAEPARPDEQYPAAALSSRSASNGHSNGSVGSYHALPSGTGHPGPPSIYTAPVVAEYQRPMPPIAPQPRDEPQPPVRDQPPAPPMAYGRPEVAAGPERTEPARPGSSRPEAIRGDAAGDVLRGEVAPGGMPGGFSQPGFDAPDAAQRGRGRGDRSRGEPGSTSLPTPGRGDVGDAEAVSRPDLYGAPVAMPFRGAPAAQQPADDDLPGRGDVGSRGRSLSQGDPSLPPGSGQGPLPPSGAEGPSGLPGLPGRERPAPSDYFGRARGPEESSGYGSGSAQDSFREETLDPHRGAAPSPGPYRRPGGASPGQPPGPAPGGPGSAGPQGPPLRPGAHSAPGPQSRPGSQPGTPGPGAPVPQLPPGSPGPQAYVPPQNGPYSGPQPAAAPGRPASGPVSLTDAVQSAHEEGRDFGESVAREAPALWLEAVLARKPRMPSDLEARLLQGSALPIDFLLHDEVRHALRRGFWDALESSRR